MRPRKEEETMSDNLNLSPELTLDPTADSALTETAAAVAQLEVPQAPSLTLGSSITLEDTAAAQKQKEVKAVQIDESMLTEAERKMVNDFSEKIDITDSNVVLQYGAAAQKNIASFSENSLNSVRTKDLGEVGQALSGLVVELKGFSGPEKKGIAGFFQKKRNELEEIKASYSKAETNVNKIVQVLENHQVTLMKDIAMLDQMYDLNTKYYKELTMYIIAGKKKLQKVRETTLEDLRKKAAETGVVPRPCASPMPIAATTTPIWLTEE